MPLIVVLGHDPVEGPVGGPQKERVGGEGPVGIDPGSLQRGDGRDDDPPLFVAEQPPLAAVGIEGRHTDPRAPPEKRCQEWGQSLPGGDDPRRRESVEGGGERLMERDMDDPERTMHQAIRGRREPEHHRGSGVGEPAGSRQPFGVPGDVVPRGVERFLVKRPGDEGSAAAGAVHEPKGRLQRSYRCPTTGRGDPATGNDLCGVVRLDDNHRLGVRGAWVIRRHLLHRQPRQGPHDSQYVAEQLGPSHDAEPGPGMGRGPAPRAENDLGADPRRITARQADERGAGGRRGRGVAGGRQGKSFGMGEGRRGEETLHTAAGAVVSCRD